MRVLLGHCFPKDGTEPLGNFDVRDEIIIIFPVELFFRFVIQDHVNGLERGGV